MKKVIFRQAIERVNLSFIWFYSEWDNGEITRCSIEDIEGGSLIGDEEPVKVVPTGLTWVASGPKEHPL